MPEIQIPLSEFRYPQSSRWCGRALGVSQPRRRGQQQRYDSYATRTWIVTRARDLFPRITVDFEPHDGRRPKSRARLLFRLPPNWTSTTVHEADGSGGFVISGAGSVLDRPRG